MHLSDALEPFILLHHGGDGCGLRSSFLLSLAIEQLLEGGVGELVAGFHGCVLEQWVLYTTRGHV